GRGAGGGAGARGLELQRRRGPAGVVRPRTRPAGDAPAGHPVRDGPRRVRAALGRGPRRPAADRDAAHGTVAPAVAAGRRVHPGAQPGVSRRVATGEPGGHAAAAPRCTRAARPPRGVGAGLALGAGTRSGPGAMMRARTVTAALGLAVIATLVGGC